MRRFFLKLWRRKQMERDLEAELAFHREMARSAGNAIPLGNVSVLKEEAYALWRFTLLENIWRDLGFALRGLRRSPGFVVSALLSLGLGIGVNTTIFSLGVEFLLGQASVRESGKVAQVRLGGSSHSKPEALQFLRDSGAFEAVVGELAQSYINWNNGRDTVPVFATQASKNYFTALGIPVSIGRGWSETDSDEVAVVSYLFWKRSLGGEEAAVGRVISLDGRAYTLLGVLPEKHRTLVGYGYSPDLYVPVFQKSARLAVVLRLKPEMPMSALQQSLTTIASRMDIAMPDGRDPYSQGIEVTPLNGLDRIRHENATPYLFFAALLVLVGLVLLIACINVAGLLLARSAARKQEIAIRLSLGASRARLLQQLLAESLLLSLTGALLGLGLALGVARALAAIPLPISIPIHLKIDPDWRVAAYAATLAVLSTLLCGLMPALQALQESISTGLKREKRMRARKALVVAQVALSFLVLTVGALFLENLWRSRDLGPGFDLSHTIRAEAFLPPRTYTNDARIKSYWTGALQELAATAGVEAAAAALSVPFNGGSTHGSNLTPLDRGEKVRLRFHWNAVTSGYFRAMQIPVVEGELFGGSEPRVVVVNEAFAKAVFGGRRAVGASFRWDDAGEYRVAGVVRGTKNMTMGEGDQPQMYEALEHVKQQERVQFIVRTRAQPATRVAAIRQTLHRVDPGVGAEVATLQSGIGLAYLPSQIGGALMGSVGLLGLLLAAIGLYGILAFSIARRAKEIGIRMAIGASRWEICRMLFAETTRLVSIGCLLGLVASALVTKPLALFVLPGVTAMSPWNIAIVLSVLSATTILATLAPLRRAMRIEPIQCLRGD